MGKLIILPDSTCVFDFIDIKFRLGAIKNVKSCKILNEWKFSLISNINWEK